MVIIFPLIYLASFLMALTGVLKGRKSDAWLFMIFGLPVYITALIVTFDNAPRFMVTVFQSFKELIILALLTMQVITLRRRLKLHFIDYAVLAFFCYTFLYVLLPVGEQGFAGRLLAFKSFSFFPLIYFSGRLLDLRRIYVSKYFHFVVYVAIAAALVALFELITSQHFQTRIGFADFYYYIYNFEPTGSYGLSFTFETDTGLRRFAGFYANPLEHAAATILALAVILSLHTTDENRIKLNGLGLTAFVATLISIFLALSRSSFLSYFLTIYYYALLTRKKQLLNFIHFMGVLVVLYFLFLLNNKDVREFIITTITFTNSSSVGHIIEWVEGINAIVNNPMGLGIGSSGGAAGGDNIGGENQLIIIGVQTGVISMLIYAVAYVAIVRKGWKLFPVLKGKEKRICLAVVLLKLGFIIPLMTSELESSAYIAYMTWFLSGILGSIISRHSQEKKGEDNPALALAPNP